MLVPESVLTYLVQIRKTVLKDPEKQSVRHLRDISGIRKNKDEFPLELSLASWQTNDGTFYTGIVRDLTEAKQMERQLLQAQKLESIGNLAAGIAHEINTSIQFVGDNLRFLEETISDLLTVLKETQKAYEKACTGQCEPNWAQKQKSLLEKADLAYLTEEMPLAIRQSLEGTERVAEIVRAMKAFSHPGPKERTYLDINQAITNTVTVARNEWKYVAECILDLDPNLPSVPVLPGEFNQVILNLVVNAAQAINEAQGEESNTPGTITLSTSQTPEFAQIRVKDNGVGIETELKDRVFDPFFTTKPVGKGTGQGLAIVYDVVVNKHGGRINLNTQPGKGAEFVLELPLEPK
jgi:signal transduction histidine kinase